MYIGLFCYRIVLYKAQIYGIIKIDSFTYGHLILVNGLWICKFSQYLCTTLHKVKHFNVFSRNLPPRQQYDCRKCDELHIHSQGSCPSVLRSRGILVNSSLTSIYVAQASKVF